MVIEMIVGALPEIAKNVAEPLSKVDKITMYGEGNGTKLVKDIINGTSQITEGISESMGLDLKSLLAGILGGKLAAGTGQQIVQQIPVQVSEQVNEEIDSTPKINEYLKDDIDE